MLGLRLLDPERRRESIGDTAGSLGDRQRSGQVHVRPGLPWVRENRCLHRGLVWSSPIELSVHVRGHHSGARAARDRNVLRGVVRLVVPVLVAWRAVRCDQSRPLAPSAVSEIRPS